MTVHIQGQEYVVKDHPKRKAWLVLKPIHGSKLQRERMKRGLSRHTMAKRMRVSGTEIKRIEEGHRPTKEAEFMEALEAKQ